VNGSVYPASVCCASKRIIGLFAASFFITFSPTAHLSAQDVVDAVSPLVDRLASPKDENLNGTPINSASLSEFKALIPIEFQSLIESGLFSFSAFRSWRMSSPYLDEQWIKEAAAIAPSATSVEVLADTGIPHTFPFGSYDKIIQQPVLSAAQKVEQILWNSQALSAARASFAAEFLWKEERAEQHLGFRGTIRRIVPRKFRVEDKTKQLFRERMTITSPKALEGLSWLTFRFVMDSEDVVWSYSPAIKKVRPLVGTNRSDPFLGTPAALDDLLGFSTKIQLVEGIATTEELLLAPFYALDSLPLKSGEPGCFNFIAEQGHKKYAVRAEPASVPQSINKLPLNLPQLVLVPRPILRLELLQRDPYALGGRQVLYVDRELFIPLYKVSYDRAGAIRKLVITPHVAVSASSGQAKTWLPSATIVYDVKAKSLLTVEYQKIAFCEQADAAIDLASFDPKALSAPRVDADKKVKAAEVIPTVVLAPAATNESAHTSGE
jgi:hypothetical protein